MCVSLLLISCSPRLVPVTVTEKDSVIVNTIETIKDTVVVIAADSSMIQMLLECDSLNNVRIKEIASYRAGANTPVPQVTISNNMLTARVDIEQRNMLLHYKQKYYEQLQKTSRDTVKIVEVNKLKWYQKVLQWLGIALLVYILILIIKLINKIKI